MSVLKLKVGNEWVDVQSIKGPKGDQGDPIDVQVNGTSVVTNGVANVPVITNNSDFGVTKVITGYGISIGNTNKNLQIDSSNSNQVKQGTSGYSPITPLKQHEAVFYGLAKLAGADMSSSSNAIGTFTSDALVKIQKMLGIYEAPWELIREDTVTNATEADVAITTDSNGNSFELTDAIVMFETPNQNNTSSLGGSGIIRFWGGAIQVDAYIGPYTQEANASARGAYAYLEKRKGGLVITKFRTQGSTTNGASIGQRYYSNFEGNGNPIFINENYYVDKVMILKLTGTGHYKLYGKRKWTL